MKSTETEPVTENANYENTTGGTMKHGIFGISSIALYNRKTMLPVALMEIVGAASFGFTPEYADLKGGSQFFPYDSAISDIKTDISITAREYSPETEKEFLGGVSTILAAETEGSISEFGNAKGTSIKNATEGIASISVIPTTGAANLKTGLYTIKAVDADTIDIYEHQIIDNIRGSEITPDENACVIKNIDVSGSTTAVASLGIQLVKGSGTLSFEPGDTASFFVRKPNSSSSIVEFGQSSPSFKEYGLLCYGQLQGEGSISMVQIYRALLGGMPIDFKEKAWSEWQGTVKALYDSSKGAVGRIFRVNAA
jgi:hypothetical protein